MKFGLQISLIYQRKKVGFTLQIIISGNCYKNSPIESFWGTLKNELDHHRRYQSRFRAIKEITEFIEVFYNRQRVQKKLAA